MDRRATSCGESSRPLADNADGLRGGDAGSRKRDSCTSACRLKPPVFASLFGVDFDEARAFMRRAASSWTAAAAASALPAGNGRASLRSLTRSCIASTATTSGRFGLRPAPPKPLRTVETAARRWTRATLPFIASSGRGRPTARGCGADSAGCPSRQSLRSALAVQFSRGEGTAAGAGSPAWCEFRRPHSKFFLAELRVLASSPSSRPPRRPAPSTSPRTTSTTTFAACRA